MDPQWIATVDQKAHAIVDSTGGRIDFTGARLIAEAEQELTRARSISNAVAANLYAAHLAGDTLSDRVPGRGVAGGGAPRSPAWAGQVSWR